MSSRTDPRAAISAVAAACCGHADMSAEKRVRGPTRRTP